MTTRRWLFASSLTAGLFLLLGDPLPVADFESNADNDWFRAWPPAGVTYSFPSTIHHERPILCAPPGPLCPTHSPALDAAGRSCGFVPVPWTNNAHGAPHTNE